MSFIEFVGFLISLAAMIFLGIKRYFEERQKQLNPADDDRFDLFEVGEEDDLFPYKKQRQKNKPQQPPPLPPHTFLKLREAQKQQPTPYKAPSYTSYYGDYGKESALQKQKSQANEQLHASLSNLNAADSYEVIQVENISRARRMIARLKSPQEMFIIKEILDKPLAIRKD
jgi:hypothetical protein